MGAKYTSSEMESQTVRMMMQTSSHYMAYANANPTDDDQDKKWDHEMPASLRNCVIKVFPVLVLTCINYATHLSRSTRTKKPS